MNLLNILLFMPQGGEEGGGYSSLIFLLLIVVVFYFFFIRPQMKRSKDQKKFREELKKGSKIITVGGIHGKILEVKETTVLIDADGTKLKVEKSAIAMDSTAQIGQAQK